MKAEYNISLTQSEIELVIAPLLDELVRDGAISDSGTRLLIRLFFAVPSLAAKFPLLKAYLDSYSYL